MSAASVSKCLAGVAPLGRNQERSAARRTASEESIKLAHEPTGTAEAARHHGGAGRSGAVRRLAAVRHASLPRRGAPCPAASRRPRPPPHKPRLAFGSIRIESRQTLRIALESRGTAQSRGCGRCPSSRPDPACPTRPVRRPSSSPRPRRPPPLRRPHSQSCLPLPLPSQTYALLSCPPLSLPLPLPGVVPCAGGVAAAVAAPKPSSAPLPHSALRSARRSTRRLAQSASVVPRRGIKPLRSNITR